MNLLDREIERDVRSPDMYGWVAGFLFGLGIGVVLAIVLMVAFL